MRTLVGPHRQKLIVSASDSRGLLGARRRADGIVAGDEVRGQKREGLNRYG
jgi:hypothetical protein